MIFGAYKDRDPYNYLNKRNAHNSYKTEYNCGGYALGIFSWYTPCHSLRMQDSIFGYRSAFTNSERLNYCKNIILEDFPNLVEISATQAMIITEYEIIAFKVCREDFHFRIKKGGNRWYEKCGASWYIDPVKTKEVFAKCWGRYDSETIFFLNKNKKIRKSA